MFNAPRDERTVGPLKSFVSMILRSGPDRAPFGPGSCNASSASFEYRDFSNKERTSGDRVPRLYRREEDDPECSLEDSAGELVWVLNTRETSSWDMFDEA